MLNRLWFGTDSLSPYWLGTDVGDRNLLGLGIAVGGGFIFASHGDVVGSRDQWAGEVRVADGALRGTRWGAMGALTLVHGSEAYRVAGADDDTANINFRAFPYRRFGGRWGATYDVSALSRLSMTLRAEDVTTELPVAPTRELTDGRIVGIDLLDARGRRQPRERADVVRRAEAAAEPAIGERVEVRVARVVVGAGDPVRLAAVD